MRSVRYVFSFVRVITITLLEILPIKKIKLVFDICHMTATMAEILKKYYEWHKVRLFCLCNLGKVVYKYF